MKIMDLYSKMNKAFQIFWNNISFPLFILFILVGVPIVSSQYGPPIVSLVQSSSTLSSTSTSHSPIESVPNYGKSYNEKTIHLKSFSSYATVLPMTYGRSWIKSEELLSILGKDHSNFQSFVVRPPKGYGIMVVIQELQIPAFNTFNQSLLLIDDNGKIVECFSKFVFQIEGKSPVDVCGRTNDQLAFHPSVIDGVGPRSFVVPEGKSISVGFVYRDEVVSKSQTLSTQVPFYDMGYIFRASIAFTAFKACPHGPPFYNENNEKLWPCDIPQSNREAVAACIREELFCDNIINCGMHDTKEFAVDEKFCREKLTSSNDSESNSTTSHVSFRGKNIRVDTTRLEEAIRNRILNSNRPYGYNDMTIQMTHSGKGSPYTTESVDKADTLSHPAFVALIILITIISVLVVGLIFRYCCNPCVGKSDPFATSSNPEAVARFHENLLTRDIDTNGQSGRAYGVTLEGIFKPVEDLPPSYNDLFPQDVVNNENSHKVYTISASPSVISLNNTENTVVSTHHHESPSPSVYTVPVTLVTPESSRSIDTCPSNSQSYFANPAFVHVEVLPENDDIASLGRRNDLINDNSVVNSMLRPSRQNHQVYRMNST